jgi:hypothetical protein
MGSTQTQVIRILALVIFVTGMLAALLLPVEYSCPPGHVIRGARARANEDAEEPPACFPAPLGFPVEATADNRIPLRVAIASLGTVMGFLVLAFAKRR